MPTIVASAIVSVAGWAGVSVTTGTAWVVAASTAITNFAVATVASYGINEIAGKKASGTNLNGLQSTIKAPAPNWEIVYGQVRKAGSLHFMHSHGTNNEYLSLVIVVADHYVDAIDEVYFNGTEAFNSAGTAQGKYSGFADVTRHVGTPVQTVDTVLQGWVTSGVWSNDHRLREHAYISLRLKWDADVFENGLPNITANIKGARLYDPRLDSTNGGTGTHRTNNYGTWEWSENPALCLRDYLTNSRYGVGALDSEIDDTLIAAAADVCEESVSLSGGGSEDRYTCNGVVKVEGEPGEIITKILNSMAGSMIQPGGEYVIHAGEWEDPTFTIDETMIISDVRIRTAISQRDRYNGVRGVYVDPDNDHQAMDYPPVESDVYAYQDGLDTGTAITSGSLTVGTGYRIESVDGGADFTGVGADSNTVGLVFVATGTSPTWGTGGELMEKRKERIWLDMDLPFTQSPSMCQRIEKIALLENRQELQVELMTHLAGMQAIPAKNVYLLVKRLGISEETATTVTTSTFSFTGNRVVPNPHPFTEGDLVKATKNSGDDLGLVDGAYYYVQETNSISFGLAATKEAALNGQRITLESGTANWTFTKHTGKPFRVKRWKFSPIEDDRGVPSFGVALILKETAEASFDWSTSEETQTDAAPNTTLPSGLTVAAPTSLSVASGTAQLYQKKDGTIVTRAKLSWTAPAMSFVTSGGEIQVQHKKNASGTWIPLPGVKGDTTEYFIWDVEDDVAYDFRIRAINTLGRPSAWETVSNHTVAGKTTAPSTASGLTVIYARGDPYLSWTDISDVDLAYYEVHRKKDEGAYAKIAEVKTSFYLDEVIDDAAVYFYKIRAVDTSGNSGSFSSEKTIATTTTALIAQEGAPQPTGGSDIGITNLALVQVEDGVHLTWDNSSPDNAAIRLVRNTTNSSLPGNGATTIYNDQMITSYYDPGLSAATYYYWVYVRNASGSLEDPPLSDNITVV